MNRHLFLLLALAVPCGLFVATCGQAAENEATLLAGLAKMDITPEQPVRMSGYASRKELSTEVHDRLYARVVAFESQGGRLVLVSTDLIGFYRTYEPIRDAICAQYELEPHELFLSSTHTHSGPTPSLDETPHVNNLQYTLALKAKLLDAVGRAIEDQQPVQYGIGRGYSPVGTNRRERRSDGSIRLGRNPYGPTDKEVLVMQLVRADGKPVAALFDYASHATSLGPKNLVISGDVLGIAEQYVERVLGDNLIAPAFAGASGDIDPWYRVLPEFNTRGGRVPAPELMGMLLGTEVLQVLSNMETASGTPEIESQFTTLQLPAKDGEGDNGADQNPTKSLNVTVARVGNIGFVGLGCELLTELGMAIKAQSPFEHTFVITHCNGGAGYLAPAKLFADGGYEIRTTRFAPAAADLFVKQTVALLRELKD